MIDGVEIKNLVTHVDERGYFREVIRSTDDFFREGFAQWNESLMNQGVAKAWHIHQKQVDWWYVPVGVIKAVLYDSRPDSSTFGETNEFVLGQNQVPGVLKIPPGVAHGCKVLSGPALLHYIVSREYDPDDEGRILHNDDTLNYDWIKGPEII